MAGTQPWSAPSAPASVRAAPALHGYDDAGVAPASTALALVMLACLGVVLVTRGRFRLVVTVVGLLAAVGGLVSVVAAYVQVPADVREVAEQLGMTAPDIGTHRLVLDRCRGVGPRRARLGRRGPVRAGVARDGKPVRRAVRRPPDDLWKAMDQGYDPTVQPVVVARPSTATSAHSATSSGSVASTGTASSERPWR